MQIAPSYAANAARALVGMAIIDSNQSSNSNGMSFFARAAIATFAASTQLSDSEVHTLVGLVADIDKLSGDPALMTKLMRNVMLLAQLMESKHPPGSEPQHSYQELADLYAQDRQKAGSTPSTDSITAQIGTLATAASATTATQASTGKEIAPTTTDLVA